MSRRDAERLDDILAAAEAITSHLERGEITDGLVFDAVRVRIIEIGEAVGALDPTLLSEEPDIPWADIKAMRNHLAYRYFDTAHAIVADTVTTDLPPLLAAVSRLRQHLLSKADVADEPDAADGPEEAEDAAAEGQDPD